MLNISLACQNDIKQVALLFDQYRVFYKMPSNIAAAEDFINNRLNQRDAIIYLARKENSAVGFMQIYPSFSSVAMQPTWILNDLFVTAVARRTGCAKQMMGYLQEEAKRNEIFSIKLATAVDNTKAKALYRQLGYLINRDFDNYSKRTH